MSQMLKPAARFHDLAINILGHQRESITTFSRVRLNFEFQPVETILTDTLDAVVNRPEFALEPQEPRRLALFQVICARRCAEELQLLVAEQSVEALDIALLISAARFGHDRVAALSLFFARGMVWMKEPGDRPEQFAQGSLGRSAPCLSKRVRVNHFGLVFRIRLKIEETRFRLFNRALDFAQFGHGSADPLRVERLELAQLLLQTNKLCAPLCEKRF